MASKFTWFPKFTEVLRRLDAESAGLMALALAEYGTDGKEPEFANPLLDALFVSLREDIDNSVRAREQNKGGRPKANVSAGKTPVSENETGVTKTETPVSKTETPVTENGTGVSENVTGVAKTETPLYINQTIPSHTIPSQAKERGKRKRFRPPSASEVAEYASAYAEFKGFSLADFDPEKFVDYYDQRDWLVNIGKKQTKTMSDWRIAVRNWVRPSPSEPRQEVTDHELDAYAERPDEIVV